MLTWYIRIIHSPMALNVTFTLCDVFPSGLAVKTNTSWFIHSFKVIKIRKKYPISKNLVESSLIHLSWYDIRSHLRNKNLLSIFFVYWFRGFVQYRLDLPLPGEGWWSTSTASTSIWRRWTGRNSKTCYQSSIWCRPRIGRYLHGEDITL